jgi:uncharacterized protein (TIGR00730 family)
MSNSYRVAVYCASALGTDPAYREAASALGRSLAEAGMGLVYGGASVGLMGAVADAALAAGAEVIGVLPQLLMTREIAHPGLTQMIPTATMHERKAKMIELANAMIALPGGYGTLDEMMEVLTWAQLGIHASPCVLINTLGFYDHLLRFLDTAVDQGFLQPVNRRRIQVVETPEEAVQYLKEKRQ